MQSEQNTERVDESPAPQEIAGLRQQLGEALAAYRQSVARLNPGLPVELIGGDTLEAVNDSVARAKALVGRIRQGIEAGQQAARVPAGSSLRHDADASALSAREKIQHGIGGR